jgi:hypothetical protein
MLPMSSRRHLASCVLLCALVAGCGTTQADSGGSAATLEPVATVGGVGALPSAAPATSDSTVAPPTSMPDQDGLLIGERVDGSRLLVIGDSIMASTSSRYGNQMCATLTPLGWQVAVEAEPSRFVEFGNDVLDEVLRDGVAPVDDWNAAVVFLGSNYRGDPLAYESELRQIVDRLAPRPVLLFTVTEYRPDWSEVNEVILRVVAENDHVTLLDWRTIAEAPGVLSGDGLHPSESGRQTLADSVAAALGPVSPVPGTCLPSVFRDDSAVGDNAPDVLGPPSTSSVGTDTSGTGSTGSSSGGTSGGSTGGSSGGSTGGSSGGSSGGSTGGGGTVTTTTTQPATTTPPTPPTSSTTPSTSEGTGSTTDGSSTDTADS